MTIGWTKGDGEAGAVFVKESSGSISNPSVYTTYTASDDWSLKGSQLGASGYYCVYNGTGSEVTVSNLSPNKQYVVRIFEYNGSAGEELYLTAAASDNPNSEWTLADVPPAPVVENISASSFDISADRGANPSETELALQIKWNPSYFVQADGSLRTEEDWLTEAEWSGISITGLSANKGCTFSAKARNGENTETAFSMETSRYTLAKTPQELVLGIPGNCQIPFSFDDETKNGNPDNTEYAVVCTTDAGGVQYVQADGSLGNPGSKVWKTATGWNTVPTATPAIGLNPGREYGFYAIARNSENIETPIGVRSYKSTLCNNPGQPVLMVLSPSSLSITIDENGNFSDTEYLIKESSGSFVQNDGSLAAPEVWNEFSVWETKSVSGLAPNTQYSFQVKAKNPDDAETDYSADASKYTFANTPGTPSAGNPTAGSIQITNFDANGNPAGTQFALQCSTAAAVSWVNHTGGSLSFSEVWGTSLDFTNLTVLGLEMNTQYFFSAIAKNEEDIETGLSGTDSETTLNCPGPSVDLQNTPVQNINTTGAYLYGNVTALGENGSEITKRGFYISTNADLSGAAEVSETGNFNTGNFNLQAAGLSGSTTYYYRAFAENDCGWGDAGYSHESVPYPNFTTPVAAPDAHPNAFWVRGVQRNPAKIFLGFQAANQINNGKGFIIVGNPCNPVTGYPNNGNKYNVDENIPNGDGIVKAVVSNSSHTGAEISGINNDQTWYFTIFPYNSNAGNDDFSYNYKTNGTPKFTVGSTNGYNLDENVDYVLLLPYTQDGSSAIRDIVINDASNPVFYMMSKSSYTAEAGNSVLIKPGFYAANGSSFLAKIIPCNPSLPRLSPYFAEESQPIKGLPFNNEEDDIVIYPNPNDGSFTLFFENMTDGEYSLEICDILSERIFFKDAINDKSINIKIENAAQGVYFLKIFRNNQIMVKKFIVR